MKTLNESFTNQEFETLKQLKGKLSWRNFILSKVPELQLLVEYPISEANLNAIILFVKQCKDRKALISLQEVKTE